jgi:hypothetical protein
MTVKVIVQTRNPEGNYVLAHECEFTRVPTVGEYIWLPIDSKLTEECFKVVYVAHKPFVELFSRNYNKHSAYIYAVQDDLKTSIESVGFSSLPGVSNHYKS